MTAFCKNENCPPSAELFQFQTGELGRMISNRIKDHLETCDFCEAEVGLYACFPNDITTEEPAAAQIPAPLYELAEALLKNRQADARSLDSLLTEKEGLVFDAV